MVLTNVINPRAFIERKQEYKTILIKTGVYMRYVAKNNLNPGRPVLRIETAPGEIAQVDFGYVGKIYDSISDSFVNAYVFVMVLGYSREAFYEIVRSQDIQTW